MSHGASHVGGPDLPRIGGKIPGSCGRYSYLPGQFRLKPCNDPVKVQRSADDQSRLTVRFPPAVIIGLLRNSSRLNLLH